MLKEKIKAQPRCDSKIEPLKKNKVLPLKERKNLYRSV